MDTKIDDSTTLPEVNNVHELFVYNGEEFIISVYINLLGREPDEHGFAYYLGRLAEGYSKSAIISEIATSVECKPHDTIIGLKKLIADERKAANWFWGMLIRKKRKEKTIQAGVLYLAQLNKRLESQAKLINMQQERFMEVVDRFVELNITKEIHNDVENNLQSKRNSCEINSEISNRTNLAKISVCKNAKSFNMLPTASREVILKSLIGFYNES